MQAARYGNIPVTTPEHLDEWIPYLRIAMHAEARKRYHEQNGGR